MGGFSPDIGSSNRPLPKRPGLSILSRLSFVTTAFIIAGLAACAVPGYTGERIPITVAYSPFESTALMWVALDRDYFEANGLDVSLVKYNSGAASLDGMLAGEADIVVGTTEFPVVLRAFQQKPMAIICVADKGEFTYLIGRKDRGIAAAVDLRGKKVGVALGTIAEFYMARYLELNGVSRQEITVVDLKTPAEWVDAVVAGEVDAVVTAQPDAGKARDGLGDNAVVLRVQSSQLLNGLVITTPGLLAANPEAATRFLTALAQAEEYTRRNPAAAKVVVQAGLNLDASYMDTVWAQNQFGLSLDQSLILAMEDEARWVISRSLTPVKTVPNFLDFIYPGSLRAVKPGAARIAGY